MTDELSGDQIAISVPVDQQAIQPPSFVFWGIATLLFVVGGLLAVGLWFQDAVPAQRINTSYLPSECKVLDKHVNRARIHDFNPGKSAISNDYEDAREFGFAPSVQIEYFVAGTKYEIWTFDGGAGEYAAEEEAEAAIAHYVVGESYPCWYDPEDPEQAVVRRLSSYRQNYTGVVAAGLLSLTGLMGLLFCARRTVQSWRRT